MLSEQLKKVRESFGKKAGIWNDALSNTIIPYFTDVSSFLNEVKVALIEK